MADQRYVVTIQAAPTPKPFLARLFGGDQHAELIKAIQSVTAMGAGEAKKLLKTLPREVGPFDTEQQAKVAARTFEEAGAMCQIQPAE